MRHCDRVRDFGVRPSSAVHSSNLSDRSRAIARLASDKSLGAEDALGAVAGFLRAVGIQRLGGHEPALLGRDSRK